jgi:hypothetical protein
MATFRNRKVWGIQLPFVSDMPASPYINYGEGKYGYVSWESFIRNLETIKIPFNGPRGGEQWKNLKEAVLSGDTGMLSTGLGTSAFLQMFFKNRFISINKKVVNFQEGSYLIELDEFIKLTNGRIYHKKIKDHKAYKIMFNTNGVYGFSIWKGNVCLEDRIWSLEECEKSIKQMLEK